ncbi:hypothetical protein Q1695_008049 [Nippostrongylus brasiliensis]|nr:hypothetical protein Q1695_008049 [Nippostrongylus brasiliensis]
MSYHGNQGYPGGGYSPYGQQYPHPSPPPPAYVHQPVHHAPPPVVYDNHHHEPPHHDHHHHGYPLVRNKNSNPLVCKSRKNDAMKNGTS